MNNTTKIIIVISLVVLFLLFSKKANNALMDLENTVPDDLQKYTLQKLKNKGYTNKFTLAAMMATIKRESEFKPQSENGYATTTAYRIKKIFPKTFKNWTEAQINAIKKDDYKFFNKVYGGRYGNSPTEGYKYRGRGLNQITFKGNYEVVGAAIGKDLVNNPDKLNDLDTAITAFAAYMEITRGYQKSAGKWPYPKINEARSQREANEMLLKLNVGTNASLDSKYFRHLTKWAPYYYKWI